MGISRNGGAWRGFTHDPLEPTPCFIVVEDSAVTFAFHELNEVTRSDEQFAPVLITHSRAPLRKAAEIHTRPTTRMLGPVRQVAGRIRRLHPVTASTTP